MKEISKLQNVELKRFHLFEQPKIGEIQNIVWRDLIKNI